MAAEYNEKEKEMIGIIKRHLCNNSTNRTVCRMSRLKKLVSAIKEELGELNEEERYFLRAWVEASKEISVLR